jgi:diguanylate cyclase (GGDEF)-like protein/PAS domain S-box-containing protein
MIGRRFPKFLLLSTALGLAVVVVVFLLFYGQYRWLAKEVSETRSAEHFALLQSAFERNAEWQVSLIGDNLPPGLAEGNTDQLAVFLNRALAVNPGIAGIQFTDSTDQSFTTGSLPNVSSVTGTTWLDERLLVTAPVFKNNSVVGTLTAAFLLDEFQTEFRAFEDELRLHELQDHLPSYLWIGGGTLLVLTLCGGMIWLFLRDQTTRLRQLRTEAEKLRDADFGEKLPEGRHDAIGDLAAVFNDMRDRLHETTHSRDYVDSILSGMNEVLIVTDDQGTIISANKAATHLLGYEEQELVDTSIDFVVDSAKSRSLADDAPSGLPKEATFQTKYGDSIPVSYTCSIISDREGETRNRIYAAQNITERQRAEKRIRYLARIDALTKIPNRMQFQHLLQRSIARARRSGGALCLFYIDIDHFKEINDTFGHGAGDTTLETVAERLKASVPENSIVGRLAGDEFAVIINDVGPTGADAATSRRLAKKVLSHLAEPFFVQGHEVFMTASLGVAYYPVDAANVIDLIRNADAALYHAKKIGGNTSSYYAPEMNEASVERLMTKSKLKRAFERDELIVHYQPKYNLETGEVFGAEALVRWELPERGLVFPSDFIPIAEETSLIIEIGEWVLDKVCEDFRIWQRSVSSPGRVSVNLSLRQLRQPKFIERVSSIMRGHEVSPTSLELEITETTLMENPQWTIKLLDELYALGLHLAIDDFGTGYSSLSALQQFPISTLKIDKSFVRNVVTSPEDATLVDTIIQMGRNLNMDVVAEGVEDEAQLNFLQSLHCTYAQGLLFGDPMSSDNYLELLLAQTEGTDSYRALFA